MAEPEVEETYADFWRDIVEVDGQLNVDQVKAELHDYRMVLSEVPRVYVNITRGRISKPHTKADAVLQVVEDLAMHDAGDAESVLEAVRAWRAALIPSTGTAPWPAVKALVTAIDQHDCPHSRAVRVYHSDGRRECGTCGLDLVDEAATPEPAE